MASSARHSCIRTRYYPRSDQGYDRSAEKRSCPMKSWLLIPLCSQSWLRTS